MLWLFVLGCLNTAYRQISNGVHSEQPTCSAFLEEQSPSLTEVLASFPKLQNEDTTGLMLLEDGLTALAVRSWLVEQATERIDVQYFIFSADNTGLMATEALLRAAQRGVTVRLLVDDTLAHGDSDLLLAMDAHPNFEVRIYNPNINIGKGVGEKVVNAVSDFRGVNQRMHNKTFTVDGTVSITGGRNIGDEYFDLDKQYNFRDRDVLLIGGESQEIQSSFDQFWGHELSVPLSQILSQESTEPEIFWQQLNAYACDSNHISLEFIGRVNNVPKMLKALDQTDRLQWTKKVHFLSDLPIKNRRDSMAGGSYVTDRLIQLVQQAEERILIQTPYLIMTELGLQLFADAERRGVEVIMLTNSLSSTDGVAAFAGYESIREELIRIGIEVYETKPDSQYSRELNTSELESTEEASVGIHAKSMLVDDDIVLIGTYNLDPRSANLNTECVVLVESPVLNSLLAETFYEEIKEENAWLVTLASNPDKEAGWFKRVLAKLLRVVPVEVL